jgi:hypothetical protein
MGKRRAPAIGVSACTPEEPELMRARFEVVATPGVRAGVALAEQEPRHTQVLRCSAVQVHGEAVVPFVRDGSLDVGAR